MRSAATHLALAAICAATTSTTAVGAADGRGSGGYHSVPLSKRQALGVPSPLRLAEGRAPNGSNSFPTGGNVYDSNPRPTPPSLPHADV